MESLEPKVLRDVKSAGEFVLPGVCMIKTRGETLFDCIPGDATVGAGDSSRPRSSSRECWVNVRREAPKLTMLI